MMNIGDKVKVKIPYNGIHQGLIFEGTVTNEFRVTYEVTVTIPGYYYRIRVHKDDILNNEN